MIQYQLPNGNVTWLTEEQYFDLSDEEFQQLINERIGESINSPWSGSTIEERQDSDE